MDEISGMREIFLEIDVDKSGSITMEEFNEALKRKGGFIAEAELQRVLAEADVNGDGTIDYEEFLAATINRSKLEREDLLRQVSQA